ncbi:RNA-binding S4 domain-containing protein [Arthrobacter sp. JCM 19049]|uniref:RNA-binding S4 domain-containing protein n=1 Tax=Arthrobacter sp. JCM 19049 TaxID=1460643 RepID=UPI002436FDA5|nr:RNA-binding S4 domain-containing protein [Arthrobacter sp. JCM 19049]
MSSEEIFPIQIRDESIRLGQLLKLANLAEDGLDAKELIAEGLVTVDGQVETRRGASCAGANRVRARAVRAGAARRLAAATWPAAARGRAGTR